MILMHRRRRENATAENRAERRVSVRGYQELSAPLQSRLRLSRYAASPYIYAALRLTRLHASAAKRGLVPESVAGVPVLAPGKRTRFLLEGRPDLSGVIDDVQASDASVIGEFQHVDHVEGGLPPAG